MALTRNRLIGNLANATDSAASSSFLAKGATEADYQSIAYSDVTGKPTILDSAGITSIIDSAYVQSRQGSAVAGLDSAGITSLVDSNYVVARAAASGSGYDRYNYTATAGQTVFQDSDNSGAVLSYTSGGIMVFYNGVMLKNTADWEGTDGSSVTLVEAADSGANVSIHKWTVAGGAGGAGGGSSLAWRGDRGVLGGGWNSNPRLAIDYWDITTPGNAADFGDITIARNCAGSGDGTYAIFSGGVYYTGSSYARIDTIDYVAIATTSNATDFGDMTRGVNQHDGLSDGTYGVFGGGYDTTYTNVIDYITIATPGNAADFGDLSAAGVGDPAAISHATTGLFAGGDRTTIDYITIATPGNASSFGNLTISKSGATGVEDATRGVICGGYDTTYTNVIEYVTIASPGNGTDFGDLGFTPYSPTGASNGTYGTIQGGDAPSATNVIEYIVIQTPGNATDFGDLVTANARGGCWSGSPS